MRVFFLRTSKQYDTLLQMGRWFGYRRGYEDLPRLWTTEDLASKFRSLAVIEEEIRADISVYRDSHLTPRDFAVKVRSIPGMAITAATKMKHAFRTSMNFSGKHVQTIRFDHRDSETVGSNWDAASQLVDAMLRTTDASVKDGGLLFSRIPFQMVRRFVAASEISEQHMDLKKPHLISYLDEAEGNLREWNVAVIQTNSTTVSSKPLGALGELRTMRRSRLSEASPRYADIKALMSKGDILIDAEKKPEGKEDWSSYKACRPNVPLLLLYLIDAKSEPQERKSTGNKPPSRVALDAVSDIVGFGMVFPGHKDRSGGYFSVDIDAPAFEETEEGEDQIEEVDGADA
ncbi:MAG: Z1 domain-containing protein [Devosia sp.]|nr:Z1 domain-containing protein [Devosia sp.]MCR6634902.1 Z1 domain-containing protein [Devosia sp.]